MATVRGVPQQDFDMGQIVQEACARWLKPPEVCDILRNYQRYGFDLNPVPPSRPASGSLHLFDRKALKYFQKDGHNWRKKKDGKAVREAHERLKSGSIDVLHCYCARGEEDPNFQRSYWMLEGAYEHTVLVQYLQVHQGRKSAYRAPEHLEPHAESPSILSSEHGDSSDDVEQLSSKYSILPETQGNFFQSDIDLNDLLDRPDMFLGQKALTPAVSLDMSGWKEVLRSYLENPTNGPVKPEDETLEQRTTRDAFLEQVSPMKFEDGMFKLSPRASLSPKAIMEVLSPRGLGRQPQTHFEAQLRAATAENAMKTEQSLSPTKRVSSPPPAQNVLVDMGRASQQEGRIKQLASLGRWALEPAPAGSSSVWLLPTKKPRFSSPGPLDVGK